MVPYSARHGICISAGAGTDPPALHLYSNHRCIFHCLPPKPPQYNHLVGMPVQTPKTIELHRLRPAVILVLGSLPAIICLAILIRGFFRFDQYSLTREDHPQWRANVVFARYHLLFAFEAPKPDEVWPVSHQIFSHTTYSATVDLSQYHPQQDLYDVLGLREFHFTSDDHTDCAVLIVPGWISWIIAAFAFAWATVNRKLPLRPLAMQSILSLFLSISILLTCLLTFLIWRSYRAWDMLNYEGNHCEFSLADSGGWVSFQRDYLGRSPPSFCMLYYPHHVPAESTMSVILRFSPKNVTTIGPFYAHGSDRGWTIWAIAAPIWAPALISAIPMELYFLFVVKRFRQSRRTRAGFCPTCGYDMHVTPDQCPECGYATTTPTSTKITAPPKKGSPA